MKVTTALLGTLAGVLLIWSFLVLAEHPARLPDGSSEGASYGSVWHCRPGHGAPTGGDMTEASRAEEARICQESRRPRWDVAVSLARAGAAVAFAAAAVGAVSVATRRTKEPSVPR